jgi:hypothetical protein
MNRIESCGEQWASSCERARQREIRRRLYAYRPPANEYEPLTSYRHCLDRQRESARWLLDLDFDFWVSMNSNDSTFTFERGRIAVRKFGALVDHHLLGRRWQRFQSQERTFFVAVPEHADGELHYHILLKLPRKARQKFQRFQDFGQGLTRKLKRKRIFPRGDAKVDQLTGHGDVADLENQLKTVCYTAGDLWMEENWNNMIISSEFHLPRK